MRKERRTFPASPLVVEGSTVRVIIIGSGIAGLSAAIGLLKVGIEATVYERVKKKAIPYHQAGRFVRFNLSEVLDSQKKKQENPS